MNRGLAEKRRRGGGEGELLVSAKSEDKIGEESRGRKIWTFCGCSLCKIYLLKLETLEPDY